jgi:hypothetical protein
MAPHLLLIAAPTGQLAVDDIEPDALAEDRRKGGSSFGAFEQAGFPGDQRAAPVRYEIIAFGSPCVRS